MSPVPEGRVVAPIRIIDREVVPDATVAYISSLDLHNLGDLHVLILCVVTSDRSFNWWINSLVVLGLFPLAGAVLLAVVAQENILGLLCHRVEVGPLNRVETGRLDTLRLEGSRVHFVFFAWWERNNFLGKGGSDAWRSLHSAICLTTGIEWVIRCTIKLPIVGLDAPSLLNLLQGHFRDGISKWGFNTWRSLSTAISLATCQWRVFWCAISLLPVGPDTLFNLLVWYFCVSLRTHFIMQNERCENRDVLWDDFMLLFDLGLNSFLRLPSKDRAEQHGCSKWHKFLHYNNYNNYSGYF